MNGCNRRSFLGVVAASSVFGLLDWLLPATPAAKAGRDSGGRMTAFRRSGRGRHVSNAAKKHNANHLYANFQTASQDADHPGDRSRVVPVVIGAALFRTLFANGRKAVDLRHDLRTSSDFKRLQQCLSGPDGRVPLGCSSADQNGDGHTDLRDLAILQRSFTSP